MKTLSSTISALFQKQLPEKEIEALVKALQKQALIAVDDKKVTYSLPYARATNSTWLSDAVPPPGMLAPSPFRPRRRGSSRADETSLQVNSICNELTCSGELSP